MEALDKRGLHLPVLKIGTPYPLPEDPVLDFLRFCQRVLVVEELEPVVEEQVCLLAWRHRLPVRISGKQDEVVPREGEFSTDRVLEILGRLMPHEAGTVVPRRPVPSLPVRPPGPLPRMSAPCFFLCG
jgi:indolepyruvate ferredoxin oxidoreductase alpha subunit